MANISQNQLRMMINQMVDQAVGEKMSQRQASWSSQRSDTQARLSYFDPKKNSKNYGEANWSGAGRIVQNLSQYDPKTKEGNKGMYKFGSGLSAIGGGIGLFNALKSGNGMGAMQSGQQLGLGLSGAGLFKEGSFLAKNAGFIGMGLGLLLSLFGRKKTKTEWNRPKFKDADKAYNKLFTVDRGERDSYYMPESFYFRNGWSGPRNIVVKVGNEQFNDHIRESMTDSYANQLQRGLVF